MQKLRKKTHNITSKMRNNASFQLYAPEDDKTENLSTLLKPADSRGFDQKVRAHGLNQPVVHVGQERSPALLPFEVFDTFNG